MKYYLNRAFRLKKVKRQNRIEPTLNVAKIKPEPKTRTPKHRINLEYLLNYFYTNTSGIVQDSRIFQDFIVNLKNNPKYINYFQDREILDLAPSILSQYAYAQIQPEFNSENYGNFTEINNYNGIRVIDSLDELDLTLEPMPEELELFIY